MLNADFLKMRNFVKNAVDTDRNKKYDYVKLRLRNLLPINQYLIKF